MRRRAHLGLALLFAAACAADPAPGPGSPEPAVVVVSGGGVVDTIQSSPTAPLVVEVRDSAGTPVAGITVRFASDTSLHAHTALIPVTPPFFFANSLDVVTDGAGRASVRLRLGVRAGTAVVKVNAPALGAATEDTITVLRGARTKLQAADTAVFIGATGQLAAAVVDRWGNAYPDVVAYTGTSVAASVSATGLVHGTSFGSALFAATSGPFAATLRVAVVPRGTIAVRQWHPQVGIALVDLDLSDYRFLRTSTNTPPCNGCAPPFTVPRWSPDGARIAFSAGYDNGFNSDPARVTTIDASGGLRMQLPPTAFARSTDAGYSKDAAWIYFAGMAPGETWYRLWRVRPDGTGAEQLDAGTGLFGHQRRPDASPDGTLLVYAESDQNLPGGPRLRIRNLGTGAVTALDLVGSTPRWSPAGDRIAYWGDYEQLHVVAPDGTGDRLLTGGNFAPAFDWSPDGKYIVAERTNSGVGIAVIEVATGTTVVLPTLYIGEPSWSPVP